SPLRAPRAALARCRVGRATHVSSAHRQTRATAQRAAVFRRVDDSVLRSNSPVDAMRARWPRRVLDRGLDGPRGVRIVRIESRFARARPSARRSADPSAGRIAVTGRVGRAIGFWSWMPGERAMIGAESLVRTLVAGGVNVCFTNPGTSEMHFVTALDRVEGMRCVLGRLEGVVTGAADGYYRMKGPPASTLLHLGPGLANGLANLHNAKKARSGIVNIVGQHATYHVALNAPLTSDIEGLARPMSEWVRTSPDAKSVAKDAADAIAAASASPPQIATLILPADSAWNEANGIAQVPGPKQQPGFSTEAVEKAAKILHSGGDTNLLLVTGGALTEKALALAQQIAGKTGCKVMGQTYHPRMARGRGRFLIDRIPYVIEQALPLLKNFKNIVLVEARDPVAFFAYPNKPSMLKPEGCEVHQMTEWGENSVAALEALADALGARPHDVKPQKLAELNKPTGPLNHASIAQAIACAIPENAIIVDESITTGRGFFPPTAASAPHDWLQNMGGSIGFSTPVATGAAVARPHPQVICMVPAR